MYCTKCHCTEIHCSLLYCTSQPYSKLHQNTFHCTRLQCLLTNCGKGWNKGCTQDGTMSGEWWHWQWQLSIEQQTSECEGQLTVWENTFKTYLKKNLYSPHIYKSICLTYLTGRRTLFQRGSWFVEPPQASPESTKYIKFEPLQPNTIIYRHNILSDVYD